MRFSNILLISVLFASTSATEEDTVNLRRRGYELPYEAPAEEEPPRRVFVKYRRNRRTVFQSELKKRSNKVRMHYDFKDMNTFVVSVPESAVEALKKNPDVEAVHDDVPRYSQYIPESIKLRKLQLDEEVIPYGIDMVQAREVWKLGARGKGVTVCVVDSGVDQNHEDFADVSGLESTDLPWGDDGVGHGTHCSGTIAAAEGNGKGVVGVAPDAKIFSVKVFTDDGGYAYSSGILSAVQECVANGADIISMSLGGPLPNIFEIWEFQRILKDSNVISVAAAGNDGNGVWHFPASYPSVISVAAMDENKTIARFSQYNGQVDIAAPGVDVLSTLPMKAPCLICENVGYDYGTISGTSMATPHVAGVLAILKSFKPNASPEDLIEAMLESAEDLGSEGKDNSFGHGLAQALAAAKYLNGGSLAASFVAQPNKTLDCGEGMMMLDLKMLTDDYASETYWDLRRITDSGVQLSGAGYDDNSTTELERCIPKNCYTFTVYDSFGDGLCCSHGNGAYSLTVDGDVLVNNAGDFDFEDMMTFGECVEDSPTTSKPTK